MPSCQPTLHVEHPAWQTALPDVAGLTDHVLERAVAQEALPDCEVAIVLADDIFIQDLNARFRGKDRPTNILSFPEHEDWRTEAPPVSLGDLIISLDTLRAEAREQNKSLAAHYMHILLHGFLHLLGYDHLTDTEAETMESKEIAILATLGIENPYECD